MSAGLRLLAPAKVNWSLEVLHIRPDGYREVRSVLQTVSLCDTLTLLPGDGIDLDVSGLPLPDDPPESNLAFRAALALRDRAGVRTGVRIVLEKRVPVAAGLGGGSSDAAAVLRGCNQFWRAGLADRELHELAAGLGSDVPFFLHAGTAAVSGRGEIVEALPDAVAPTLLLAAPPPQERGEKTAAMYAALSPHEFSEGEVTREVREAVEAGHAIDDSAVANVFERVITAMQPETELAMDALRAQGHTPHLAGAGPSFFLLVPDDGAVGALSERVRALGFEPFAACVLPRAEALRVEAP